LGSWGLRWGALQDLLRGQSLDGEVDAQECVLSVES
jgi:hypothetical protein